MKRLALLVVFSLMALPVWADYGLSNVVTKQIDGNQPAEQSAQPGTKMSLTEPVKNPEPAKAAETPVLAPDKTAAVEQPQFKKTAFYPYTIHISSWRNSKDAVIQLKQKYQNLDGVFITKIDLGERGIWFRIDAGAFASLTEASARMKDLKEKGVIDTESFIGSSVPLAIELKVFADRDQAQKMADKIRSNGVVSYIMKESETAYRVLVGAFPDRKSGLPALNDLAALGLKAKIAKR